MLYGTLKLIFMEITRIELSLNDRVDEVLTAIRDASRRPAAAGGGGGISRSELRTTLDAVLSRQLGPLRADIEEIRNAVLHGDTSAASADDRDYAPAAVHQPATVAAPVPKPAAAAVPKYGDGGGGSCGQDLTGMMAARLPATVAQRRAIAVKLAKALGAQSSDSDDADDPIAAAQLPASERGSIRSPEAPCRTISTELPLLDEAPMPGEPAKSNAAAGTARPNFFEAVARSADSTPPRGASAGSLISAAAAKILFLTAPPEDTGATDHSDAAASSDAAGKAAGRSSKAEKSNGQEKFNRGGREGTGAVLQATLVFSPNPSPPRAQTFELLDGQVAADKAGPAVSQLLH